MASGMCQELSRSIEKKGQLLDVAPGASAASPSTLLKAIADPRFGDEPAWAARVRLQFSPNLTNEDVQRVRIGFIGRTPDGSKQGAMSDDLTGMDGQICEHLIFRRREVDRLFPHHHLASLKIYAQRSCLEARFATLGPSTFGCMAQGDTNPSQLSTRASKESPDFSPGEELPPVTLDRIEHLYYNQNVLWALLIGVAWKPQAWQTYGYARLDLSN